MTAPRLSILLDLDGTVVDSLPGIRASCLAALCALGHRADDLEMEGLIGPPLEEVLAQVLGRFGDDRVAEAVVAYRAHYGAEGYRETSLYPGLAEALDALGGVRARLFIATSKRTVFARQILEHLGLADRFEAICGSEPGGAVDRKAELISDLLARHRLAADRCVMVGDRRQDVDGGRANGVATVGVLWGYGDREELTAAGATHIISRPAELIPIAESRRAS